jgi:hypothetical protein
MQDSVRIDTFEDDGVIQPPERVAAPEGGGASSDDTLSTAPAYGSKHHHKHQTSRPGEVFNGRPSIRGGRQVW